MIIYQNGLHTQEDINRLFLEDERQGTHALDYQNFISGNASLRMETNPNIDPWYFYLYDLSLPLVSVPIRLEMLAEIDTKIQTFGIGWHVYKDGKVYVMFARLNFTTGNIELLQSTEPHIWQIVAPIPYLYLRRDNPLQPFRIWLEVDPTTMTYVRFGYHAFCLHNGANNKFDYPLSTVAVSPKNTEITNGLIIKVNPQSKAGVIGTAWANDLEVSEIEA